MFVLFFGEGVVSPSVATAAIFGLPVILAITSVVLFVRRVVSPVVMTVLLLVAMGIGGYNCLFIWNALSLV